MPAPLRQILKRVEVSCLLTRVLEAEPHTPVYGMIAQADGVVWNPVSSGIPTLVFYGNSGWVPLVGTAQPSDTITTTLLVIAGTTHTAEAADNGKVYLFTNVAGCALTVPDTLTAGWSVGWVQDTLAGTIAFAGSGSMDVFNRQGHTDSAGPEAMGTLLVTEANVCKLGGDTA